jgi:hypothetical protein
VAKGWVRTVEIIFFFQKNFSELFKNGQKPIVVKDLGNQRNSEMMGWLKAGSDKV